MDSAVLLAESDHRIANHLTLLMGYVRRKTADMDNQCEAPSRWAVHALLEGVGAQISAVAKLHRALVSDTVPAKIDLAEHLRGICAPFADGLSGGAAIIEDFETGCAVAPDQVLPLIQIAAEVLTNAMKHASDSDRPGTVLVRCRNDEGAGVRLEIIDNGGGFPAGFNPEVDGGLGFRLVRGLSQKLGARITFDSTTSGLRFSLALPVPGSPQERGASQK